MTLIIIIIWLFSAPVSKHRTENLDVGMEAKIVAVYYGMSMAENFYTTDRSGS